VQHPAGAGVGRAVGVARAARLAAPNTVIHTRVVRAALRRLTAAERRIDALASIVAGAGAGLAFTWAGATRGVRAAGGVIARIGRAGFAVIAVDRRVDAVTIFAAGEVVPDQTIAVVETAAIGIFIAAGRCVGHTIVGAWTALLGRVAA
jgi:hypothetical protein